MIDQDRNNIPDVWDRRLAVVFGLLILLLGAGREWFGPDIAVWLARGSIVLGLISNYFGWGWSPRPGKENANEETNGATS